MKILTYTEKARIENGAIKLTGNPQGGGKTEEVEIPHNSDIGQIIQQKAYEIQVYNQDEIVKKLALYDEGSEVIISQKKLIR